MEKYIINNFGTPLVKNGLIVDNNL